MRGAREEPDVQPTYRSGQIRLLGAMCMSKRVAVLMVRNLTEAVLRRRIQTADSEPYWLGSQQCEEGDREFSCCQQRLAR
jgi:hypothetical protein